MAVYEVALIKEERPTHTAVIGEVVDARIKPANWTKKEREKFNIVEMDLTKEELVALFEQ